MSDQASSPTTTAAAAGGGGGGGGGGEAVKKPTAKELRMLERAKAATDKAAADAAKAASSGVYGDLPMVQSSEITGRVWTRCVPSLQHAGPQTPPPLTPLLHALPPPFPRPPSRARNPDAPPRTPPLSPLALSAA